MEKIKRYWREIVMVLLAVLWLRGCTQSCTRKNELNIVRTELQNSRSFGGDAADSIKKLNMEIKMLNVELESKDGQLKEKDSRIQDLNKAIESAGRKSTTINVKVPEKQQ